MSCSNELGPLCSHESRQWIGPSRIFQLEGALCMLYQFYYFQNFRYRENESQPSESCIYCVSQLFLRLNHQGLRHYFSNSFVKVIAHILNTIEYKKNIQLLDGRCFCFIFDAASFTDYFIIESSFCGVSTSSKIS